MSMVKYYHYTDREGLRGILKSRKIRMSRRGKYGPGVYLTTLSPKYGRKKIAKNNWDGIWQVTEFSGKVDYAISVLLPDCKVERCHREIYLLDEDVNLDMTTYKLFSKHGDHDDLEESADDWSGDEDSSDEDSSD